HTRFSRDWSSDVCSSDLVTLKEDTIKMEELVISGETVFSRKEMLAVFREQFLGKTKAGNSCKILNEDDIRLYYEIATNTLRAERSEERRVGKEGSSRGTR